ncbi:MAG: ribosome maturation factor RimP [Cyanosarcina radialis HA8281-LM2]|nr:ribosome maturation factor RimP [Cyanosarcina radialis HA8281-LM2]
MTHPLIPQIMELATAVGADLELEVVGAVFHTNQRPPVLRVDIRNPLADTSLDDCERMSKSLEAALDVAETISEPYVLEISSPGVSRNLTADRDFISFKGFPVTVTTAEPWQGKSQWQGQLINRDDKSVQISQKGRAIAIPLNLVAQVKLDDHQ